MNNKSEKVKELAEKFDAEVRVGIQKGIKLKYSLDKMQALSKKLLNTRARKLRKVHEYVRRFDEVMRPTDQQLRISHSNERIDLESIDYLRKDPIIYELILNRTMTGSMYRSLDSILLIRSIGNRRLPGFVYDTVNEITRQARGTYLPTRCWPTSRRGQE